MKHITNRNLTTGRKIISKILGAPTLSIIPYRLCNVIRVVCSQSTRYAALNHFSCVTFTTMPHQVTHIVKTHSIAAHKTETHLRMRLNVAVSILSRTKLLITYLPTTAGNSILLLDIAQRIIKTRKMLPIHIPTTAGRNIIVTNCITRTILIWNHGFHINTGNRHRRSHSRSRLSLPDTSSIAVRFYRTTFTIMTTSRHRLQLGLYLRLNWFCHRLLWFHFMKPKPVTKFLITRTLYSTVRLQGTVKRPAVSFTTHVRAEITLRLMLYGTISLQGIV